MGHRLILSLGSNTMYFWIKIIACYLAAVMLGFCLSLAVTLLTMALLFSHDDSPALGMVLFGLCAIVAAFLIPVSLGVVGELLQRNASVRRFQWSSAGWRALRAIPLMLAPSYSFGWVLLLRPDSRQKHWPEILALLCCFSAVFGYRALRIDRAGLARKAF